MMNNTVRLLQRLMYMDEFGITKTKEGFIFKGDGVSFIYNYDCNLEEAIEEAYIHIRVHSEAKELVKRAKVSLD